jgi:transcriptional regulator with XRE-family HTH domain
LLTEKQQEIFYKWLGDQLKKARINKGATQQDLAEQLNLNRVSMANIEKGKQKIQIHNLIEAAHYLQISFDSLYNRALVTLEFESSIDNRISKELNPSNIKGFQNVRNFINETRSKNTNP